LNNRVVRIKLQRIVCNLVKASSIFQVILGIADPK
jgi:hypothetical protein